MKISWFLRICIFCDYEVFVELGEIVDVAKIFVGNDNKCPLNTITYGYVEKSIEMRRILYTSCDQLVEWI